MMFTKNQRAFRPRLMGIVCLLLLLVSYAYATATSYTTYGTSSRVPHELVNQNVELIGQIGGASRAVAVDENYAYIGVGPRLLILDISTPATPMLVGQSMPLPETVRDVAVVDKYAYVANHEAGLRIIDVSNPAAPVEVASFDIPGQAYSVAVAGSYAYVGAGSAGLRIIDVTNPATPQEVSSHQTPGIARGVTVVGNYAYVGARTAGLRIIDVSNPAAPQEVGSLEGWAFGVAVAGDYAYVAGGTGGFDIVNVANPAAPYEVASLHLNFPQSVALVGNYAYLGDAYNGGLWIIDISDPNVPSQVAFFNTLNNSYNVTLAGSYAYLADGAGGLRIIDVTNPATPFEEGSFEILGKATSVAIAGNHAYLADGTGGLQIINVSHPVAPSYEGSLDTQGVAWGVAVADSYAYVADEEAGLRIIDITTPAAPAYVGTLDTPGKAYSVAVAGHYAYVADGEAGLRIINVTNPAAPTEVGSFDTPGDAWDVAVADNYAYVADYERGLRIIDVQNPAAPIEVAFFETPGNARGVALAAHYAYVADHHKGLRIIDVSNPAAPSHVGFLEGLGYATSVAVVGNYAYVSDSYFDSGLLNIIDVTNPATPLQVSSFDTPGSAYDVALADGYAYVADWDGGLYVLQFTESPSTPTPSNATNTPIAPTATTPPEASPTATEIPNATTTPSPTPNGNFYEPNDTCSQAQRILTDGSVQVHRFETAQDEDWLYFDATQDHEYLIEAQVPAESVADISLFIYGECGSIASTGQDYAFSPTVRLRFTSPTNGRLFMRLRNEHDDARDLQSYHLSVRDVNQGDTHGALIIVAGRLRQNDRLQDNIYHVTDAVYDLFQENGHPADQIYYLAPDTSRPNVNAAATVKDLQAAITNWALDQVGPNQALTLYMMDHGDQDFFYLDEPRGQRVTSTQLDSWLTELENSRPGVRINVIYEACFSGSFIRSPNTISKPGRVVITSTSASESAYASPEGAIFSDHLLNHLRQGSTLYNSFLEARWATQAAFTIQTPWLDDDGDGMPNDNEDGQVAARRGFAFAGSFDPQQEVEWPPYIAQVEAPTTIENGRGTITTSVLIDERQGDRVQAVWAIIYPPSYEPPKASVQMVELPPTVPLIERGNDEYQIEYPGFNEVGTYQVTLHAKSVHGWLARPVTFNVQNGSLLYLPMITR